MKTIQYTQEQTDSIAHVIINGGFVAIMTDTVYGLACRSNDEAVYEKLKMIKGRPANKPFPLMVSSLHQLEQVASVSPRNRRLIARFMPGPVTFVLPKKHGVFPFLATQKTLGIRMATGWTQALIDAVQEPIWLPSANVSGEATAVSSDMVLKQLNGLIDGVVVGECLGGVSSAVFDLSQDAIVCLRKGIITMDEIMKEAEYESSDCQ